MTSFLLYDKPRKAKIERARVRRAVAAHRAELIDRGLARVEAVVEREVADELRGRARAERSSLSNVIARILAAEVRK